LVSVYGNTALSAIHKPTEAGYSCAPPQAGIEII